MRRAKWLQANLARVLFRILPTMPLEICYQISKYLIREHSVQLARDAWSRPQESISKYSTSRKIWAGYVSIEGRRYICALSSEKQGSCSELFLTPRGNGGLGTMYIAEDHLGIRKVLFNHSADYESLPAPVVDAAPGIWWRATQFLEVEDNPHSLVGQSDVGSSSSLCH